jgi:hypothetical protein
MVPGFRVVAIVAAYNEADIIEQVVADLIDQRVQVYLLDDGSTDGTVAAVERFVGRGLLAIEPLAGSARATDRFDWARILERKAAVARDMDADWFVHHDADEFRESPWRGVSLGEAIARVDAAGYNAIDFASLDFWPTHDRFRAGDDVRASFTHYAEREPYDRVQVRAWKRTAASVDLASSGGHDVQFPGRRVFPLRFISRHYPIRGEAHGSRKVVQDRRGRFRDDERARGWHVQYDGVSDGGSFVRDASTLTAYDPDAVRLTLTLRHRGVEALESALEEARCVADAQRRELRGLQAALDAQHDDLEVHRVHLEQRARDLDAHRRELDRHRREFESAERELAVRAEALGRTTAELEATRAELDRCAAWAVSLESELKQASAFGAVRDAALADRSAALEAAIAKLSAVEAESTSRAREIADARELAAHQARTLAGLQAAVREHERRADHLERSLSWRLTAPARALLRALRGR